MSREPDHYHCPSLGCYWRIQYLPTCSRCGGNTVKQEGCCALDRVSTGKDKR